MNAVYTYLLLLINPKLPLSGTNFCSHSGEIFVHIKLHDEQLHITIFLPGILQGVYWGLGGGLGAILGGVLIDEYGAVPSFRLGALMSGAVLIVSGFIQYCISYHFEERKSEEKHAVEHTME